MKRATIILFMGIVCALFSTAFGQTKSAKEVWDTYKANPKMYTFLDALTASQEPKTFIPYLQEFVNTTLDYNKVEYNVLKEEFVETILKKDPEVALYFGICLALRANTIPKVFSILKMLPKANVFYNGDLSNTYIESQNLMANDSEKISTINRPEIRNVLLMPDGRILISTSAQSNDKPWYKFDDEDRELCEYSSMSCELFRELESSDVFTFKKNSILMFDPNGTSYFGFLVLKDRQTGDGCVQLKDIRTNDIFCWISAFTLDNNGKITGDKMVTGLDDKKNIVYCSFAEAEKIAMKKAGESVVDAKKQLRKLNQQLITRYGEKAYNAMCNNAPYKGMPEGAVSQFRYYINGVAYYKYKLKGTFRDRLGFYKKYEYNLGVTVSGMMPTIFVRGGKVVSWKNMYQL